MGIQKGRDVAERLVKFAAGVFRLGRSMPKDSSCRHVASQMTRAATSTGANYEEARGAESRSDFVHKVGVAVKELREAAYWLRFTQEAALVRADIAPLLGEANELTAILVASRKTAIAHR